jgi:hypothetical protein
MSNPRKQRKEQIESERLAVANSGIGYGCPTAVGKRSCSLVLARQP